MTRLRDELGQAPKSSRKYTVANAFEHWLAGGLPGRSENTKDNDRRAILGAHRQVRDEPRPGGQERGEPLYGYSAVSLLSGLRAEEVRALHWEHVHLDYLLDLRAGG